MDRPLCLVTGASSGIGAALAREFAAHGWDLALSARREDRLTALAQGLKDAHGAESQIITDDLADPSAPARILDAVRETGRPIAGLVNNAGYGLPGGYEKTSWADQARFLQIMVTAPAEFAHRVFTDMLRAGYGRIINVASVAGLIPGLAGHTLYGPAKAFLIKMSESLATEAADAGADDLHISALCPGLTHSEFHDVNGMRATVSATPGALWQTAEEVARIGYAAVERGSVVQVCGRVNKSLTFAARMAPPGLGRKLAARGTRAYGERD